MSNKELVERDIRDYLAKAENLRHEDKVTFLRALFDKHYTFTMLDHIVTRHDLFGIISDAKSNFTRQRTRPYISGKQVDQSETTHVSMIEAFIGYLNRNGLAKKLIKFDYTDEADQYEVLD